MIVGSFVAAALVLVGLLRMGFRRAEPLLDPRFFGSVPFSAATLTAVEAFSAFAGFLFLDALYLQDVRGYSPLHAVAAHVVDGRDHGAAAADLETDRGRRG